MLTHTARRKSWQMPEERHPPLRLRPLLGKVYLWKRDFANAETTLGNIVNNGGLQLVDLSDII